ncbi:Swarming motility protein SwrC [Bacillus sp. THAF10]|uniref:efflux RND transporter permease subunit n=1 Tax=Bacillus sp. THAF10 TaxID=2587848 RepID=UPI001268197C|nr:efflux RND transporter permease subunit [Bacillus sp. THAF10]QFT88186.1 Swarming motility protein SwrC [Bacillus sp. THAF10]
MIIPKIAVKRPVTTIMMMLLVLLLGFVSLTNLKLDLMPNINPPVLAVMTSYPGAGPEEVAEIVTKPIEDVVGTSAGLQTMQSRSSSNSSLIIAQYEWGTEISEVREDLSSSLNLVRLPDAVNQPMIMKFDPTMMPIVQFSVSSGEEIQALQETVNDVVVPKLQNIEGVASVNVTGGFDEEIKVTLNEENLKKYDLTQSQIVQLIQGNNLTMPGGIIEEDGEKLNLRILAKVETVDALKNLPVSIEPKGQELEVVTLEEVAKVELSPKDVTSFARTNGTESLMVSIQKEGTANTAEVSKQVQDRLSSIAEQNSDLTFDVAMDQGEVIERSISNVTLALVFGGIFAVAVIIVFLRSIASTLIVGIAIPFSVIATFVLMYFSGMTLNIMSLGGLALGVGMLVDNAIVVIENIYRHLTKGGSRKEAAITGAAEVGGAVTASMLTTLSVFLPIVFVGGMIGDIFKELALTVTFALLASWAVALTVVPALAGLLLKPEKVKSKKESVLYKKIISWALDHRLIVILLAIFTLVGSLFLAPRIGTEFMPAQDEGTFSINMELPEGASFERTLELVEEVEGSIENVSEVDIVTATIGNADEFMAAATGSGENVGSLTVKLVSADERERSTEEVMNALKKDLASLESEAELTYNLSNSMEAMSGAQNAVEVMLLGNDKEKLQTYTEELTTRLQALEEVNAVSDSIQTGKPVYQFILDKEEAFKYGLTAGQVGNIINEALQGNVAATMFDTEIRVHMEGISNSKEELENLSIPNRSGQEITLKDIGEIERGEGPVTVVRENQQDSVVITANFEGQDMGTVSMKVQAEIDDMVKELDINTDQFTIKTGGGAEMMDDAFASLLLAVVLAIVFVYMVMASQFESLLQPFIIMFTLPLAIIGVVLGLFFTGYAFGVTAFIGIIILVGIVVNNAIVFIDYTNQLRAKGLLVREALMEAGVTRLRPIIMTALTTILGLLPLAIGLGEGTELQAPMAVAVIGGLLSSTVLTLVVIPVIYSLLTSRQEKKRLAKLEG